MRELLVNSLRKRFVKDQGIPIQLVQSPYFEYYLNELEDFYPGIENKYIEMININAAAGNILDYSEKITSSIISDIKYNEYFKEFLVEDMKKFNVPQNHIMSKQLYLPENSDSTFISIDLKKANFTSLK